MHWKKRRKEEEEKKEEGKIKILFDKVIDKLIDIQHPELKAYPKIVRQNPNFNKSRERHDFQELVKEKVLERQRHRCADCKVLNVVDWHHRNGDRSDNSESNCVALCPNCHAIRTRRHS